MTIKAPTKTTLPAEILTQDEVLALMDACSRRAPTGIRNRALIVLLWRTGLRISEALALKPSDIDHKARTVRVLRGKGSKDRTVGIDGQALDALSVWLETRKGFKVSVSKPLFCQITTGKVGEPVDSSYIRHALARLRDKAGIAKRVHPHGFRHTHAVELLNEGANIGVIRQLLGHSSVAVTDAYLQRMNPKEAITFSSERTW